ncbi:MAG: cadherin-like beta sandwich domain-containing protein, partial [Lachnospiraceae bacterium]|nr:cadherin-like beta sandwich domain-containing protein [Lachnospiraceae bacterium]
ITEPTTEAPTTEPPTTEAPSTEPPTTEPPTTEAPTPPPTTQPPERPSSNAFLDDMSVYPGTLSPAFDPNEMYYDVTVGYDVTKITVDAVTADVDAVWKINVWGSNDNLQVGKNIIDIKVTAADGTVKWYAIFVYREAPPTTEAPEETTTDQPIEPPTAGDQPTEPPMTENQPTEEDSLQVMIGSVTGRVQETLGAVARPEGFEEVTYTFNGVQVEALKGIGKDLLLLPVSDGTETKLYIYDADKNGFYPYVGIQITSALYTVIPFEAEESIPEGYRLSTVNYEGTLIDAWVRNDAVDSTYAVFYAMNWDGVISLYRFDAGEKTLQRVNKWELSVSKEPGTSSGSNELPGQTDAPGSSEAPTVNGDYIDYYEETLKKINRRDTFMFIIMVLMLASMLAMYLLFVVGDKKDQATEGGDGPEDDPDEEYIEEEYSDEDEEYYVDDEDEVSDEDVTDEDVAADEDEEKQIQEELASIVAGMADFMADVDKTAEEKNTKEDIDDLELEDLDLDDIE